MFSDYKPEVSIFRVKREPEEILSTIKIEAVQYACPNPNCNRVFDKWKARNTHFSRHCIRRPQKTHLINHYHANNYNHVPEFDYNQFLEPDCDDKTKIKRLKPKKRILKKNKKENSVSVTTGLNVRKCVAIHNKKREEILKKRAEINRKRQLTMQRNAIIKSETQFLVNGDNQGELISDDLLESNYFLTNEIAYESKIKSEKKKKQLFVQRFPCPNKKCQRNYKTKQSLNHHLKFCNKNHKYRCWYCPFKSQFKYAMKTHLRNKHAQKQFRFRVLEIAPMENGN